MSACDVARVAVEGDAARLRRVGATVLVSALLRSSRPRGGGGGGARACAAAARGVGRRGDLLDLLLDLLEAAAARAGLSTNDQILDGRTPQPVSSRAPDAVGTALYVDNYAGVGAAPGAVREALTAFSSALTKVGFNCHALSPVST